MREPSNDERKMERAFLFNLLTASANLLLLLIFAIITGSLTVFGQSARGMLMISGAFYSLWVLWAVHRGRLNRYEYGVGKVEQFASSVMGLGLIVTGLWVAQTVIQTILSAEPAASPRGLALAAFVQSIGVLRLTLSWFVMAAVPGAAGSVVIRTILRVQVTMMISNCFTLATLTAAALAMDDAIALILDVVGAIFVTSMMLFSGFSMLARSLPDLLDAPAPADLSALIRRTVASAISEDDIVSICTRRSGKATFAQVMISSAAVTSVAALRERTTAINDALRREGAEVDLAVVVNSDDLPVQSAG